MQSKPDRQMCGTCEYWTGKREPAFDRQGKPKVNIHDMHAKCSKQNHRFTDENRWRDQCCIRYCKWTEIL